MTGMLRFDQPPRSRVRRAGILEGWNDGKCIQRALFQYSSVPIGQLTSIASQVFLSLQMRFFQQFSERAWLTEMNRYATFWLRMSMKAKWSVPLGGALMALMARPLTVQACAVCVTGAGDATTDAFNWSVLFLMAAPYLVVGSIAGGLFFAYRRSAVRREQPETTGSHVHLAWNDKESGR